MSVEWNKKHRDRIKLRKKLADILEHTPQGKQVYDLCCDHGDFGLACLLEEKFEVCIFIDKQKKIIV